MFSTEPKSPWVVDFSQPLFKTYGFNGRLKPTTRMSYYLLISTEFNTLLIFINSLHLK